jgi:hypothetical protein
VIVVDPGSVVDPVHPAREGSVVDPVQTAFYSHLLAGLQGAAPRWTHLALGYGRFVPFR